MANLRANKIYGTSGPDANGSALFNGTDYLTASNAAAFRLNQGSGADLTIEAWIYAKSVGTQFVIASLYHTTGNKRSYNLLVNSDGELKFNYSSNGTAGTTSTLNAGTIPTNEWIHVALTHDTSATTVRLFKNGLLKDDETSAMATWYANTDGDFVVGSSLDGFISNLHINKGTCKYTASFDPYKQPIEVETNTSVLCCNSSTDALNDDKSNTFVQTASGGVKPASDMPFSRSDAGVVIDGYTKINSPGVMYFPTGDTSQRGRGRAVMGGGTDGSSDYMNTIDYFSIPSEGNSIDFGDLSYAARSLGACSSSTRGLFAGGMGPSSEVATNSISYITIATTANGSDFGDLSVVKRQFEGLSNQTRGIWPGGQNDTPASNTEINSIDYVTIATTGNASDFGDIQEAKESTSTCASSTRGLIAGGDDGPAYSNTIGYITIATTGNATNFGDLTLARSSGTGCSNETRGLFFGGRVAPSNKNIIEYVTIATTGNSTDFGDLPAYINQSQSGASQIRGVLSGGNPNSAPLYTNIMQFVTIATTGNSSDFGDTTAIKSRGGTSDCHGGLS